MPLGTESQYERAEALWQAGSIVMKAMMLFWESKKERGAS
jgi:hypothetical protein